MIRPTFDLRMPAGRGTLILGLSMLGTAALGAQSSPASQADSRWLPLLGCWHPSSVAPGDVAAAQSTVCIVRTQGGRSVDVVTVARGAVADRVSMTADAQLHVLSKDGCTGWEQAEWSTSGRIVYLHSEFTCQGGTTRATSGVISMVSPQEWVEVQTVKVGGGQDVRVSRYTSVFDPTGVPADIAAAATDQRFASDAARVMYASDLTVPEVLEASKRLDASTVEGWLVETGARRNLHMDAKALAQFSHAGVSSNITDLLVAMSYPDVFRIEHSGDIATIPTEPRQPAVVDNSLFDHRPYDTFDAFDPYYDPYYDPYAYGAYNPYSYYGSRAYGPNGSRYYSSYSTVIVTVPSGGGSGSTVGGSALPQEPPGKVVNGRGYTRGSGTTTTGTRGTGSSRNVAGGDNSSSSSGSSSSGGSSSSDGSTASSGSSDGGSSSSSSSGNSGSASSDGYSAGSGSSSTGRTAKPRDPNPE